MGLFGITIDEWAIGSTINLTTIVVQSICLCISLFLLFIRMFHVLKHRNAIKSYWKFASLQLSQLLMTFFSCLYLFYHQWNYIHLYLSTNPMNCAAWFAILMASLTCTRVLLFWFLMLRSSLAFESKLLNFTVPLKLSITLIIVTAMSSIATVAIVLSDFRPTHPFSGKGFCFRFVGQKARIGAAVFHAIQCISSIVALIIFCWKARAVKKSVAILRKGNKMNDHLLELDDEFRKHIKLGMITIIGTIIIFFVQDITSVTLGMIFALDQTANNVLTFIMFKENSKIYEYLCCNVKKPCYVGQKRNIINIIEIKKSKIYVHSVSEINENETLTPNDTTDWSIDANYIRPPGPRLQLHPETSVFDASDTLCYIR